MDAKTIVSSIYDFGGKGKKGIHKEQHFRTKDTLPQVSKRQKSGIFLLDHRVYVCLNPYLRPRKTVGRDKFI